MTLAIAIGCFPCCLAYPFLLSPSPPFLVRPLVLLLVVTPPQPAVLLVGPSINVFCQWVGQ